MPKTKQKKWTTIYPTNLDTGTVDEMEIDEAADEQLTENQHRRIGRGFLTVTKNGTRIRLRAADCGADCFCDATYTIETGQIDS